MKLNDLMMRAKCGVLVALFATGLPAFAADPVRVLSVTNAVPWDGRVTISCVVSDPDVGRTTYGINYKLQLDVSLYGEPKDVRHLHRIESTVVEYDDMMVWLKNDGQPESVTLVWDAALDGVTEDDLGGCDYSVAATKCADAIVEVANGKFVGVLDTETMVRSWKGIPYAAQPTGANRWKAMGDPVSSADWFAAKQFGHAAIQTHDPSETGGFVEQGDDCLVLNVWSTDEESGYDYGRRPVMVYIHGGAFLLGGSADLHYDGRNIVERNKDVVVVAINYRVGLMGFIDLKSVPGGEEFADSPNLAILDQRQALKWVHENIARFGGDPDNVTIFGESAGGGSVAVHLTSSESAPYFRRAIQMSGALDLTMTEKAYEERQLTRHFVAAAAELRKTNYVDMAVLQSLTADEIRQLMETKYADPENPGFDLAPDDLSGGACVIGSIMNYPMSGARGVVPSDPFTVLATNGVANGKDYMVGSTRDEWRYFADYDGPDDPLRGYYTGLLSDRMRQDRYWFGSEHEWRITNFLATVECERDEMDTRYPDIWKKTALENLLSFRFGAIRMAEIHAGLPAPENGTKGRTYMYRFDKARVYADRPWAGAGHACEVDYVFGNTGCVDAGPIDEDLADAVNTAFVNFARCGNPNGVGESEWNEYDVTDRKTMLFRNDCTTACVSDPDGAARELLMPAFDTYTRARSDAERRTKTGLAFVREPEPPKGTSADPWQVGRTADDDVIAFTNASGRLFVEGTGGIRDFYALGGGLWFGETMVEAEFGEGVTSVGANMLSTCGELKRIVFYGAEPPDLGENALPLADDLDVIYVPEESVNAYMLAWPEYKGVLSGISPGCEEMPWKLGVAANDTVGAYIECSDRVMRLVVTGDGEMKDFEAGREGAPRTVGMAPWGEDVTECLVSDGVKNIGANAFAGCRELDTVVLYGQTPPALGIGNTFAGVKIFVPTGSAAGYRAAWPALAGQIEEMRSARRDLSKQLYEIEYRWWDADKANCVAENLAETLQTLAALKEIYDYFFPYGIFDWYDDASSSALCTSCRNGNFVGRNFDWAYDDVDECVMRVPADEGRFASVGVASRFFPQSLQDLFGVEEFLPELTMDGVNEKGVAMNVNVVPAGDNGETTGTNPGAERLCAGFAVRPVLDAATNAAHAVEILRSRDIYSIKGLEFHWMISDATESYVVECAQNELVVLRAKNARPKMANFYVSHSPYVYDEYEVVSDNEELTEDEHTPHAMGIERYNRVADGLESVDSVATMFTRMTNVWYKLKYLPGNEERYWSDLNGAPVPGVDDERFEVGDEPFYGELRREAFKSLQANYVAVTNYEARWGIRDTLKNDPTLTNQVVHTVHTSIYDLEKRELTVCVQEDVRTIRTFGLFEECAPGSEQNPWKVGEEGHESEVTAWTNGTGTLVVEGSGAVGSMPWAESASGITDLVKSKGVTGLETLVGSLPDVEYVNGLASGEFMQAALGFVKASGFSAIEVKDERALLDVVVARSDSLDESAEWTPVSTNSVTVPAPGEQGFFILMSKPSAPTDAPHAPIFIPEIIEE